MKTIKITKSDLDKENRYKKGSIGAWDAIEDVSVEIDEGLGYVVFEKGVYVKGSITAQAGSGIKAGWGIEAGSGIKAGWGIEAGWGIKAGESIEAGWGIKAGWGIEAGSGIVAGLSITCKLALSFKKRLFAGVAWWRDVSDEEKKITCGKLEGGTVCYGDVKELRLPDAKVEVAENADGEIIELNGKKYKRI